MTIIHNIVGPKSNKWAGQARLQALTAALKTCDAFFRTNRRAIAIMFVCLFTIRLSVRPSVRLSVWDGCCIMIIYGALQRGFQYMVG